MQSSTSYILHSSYWNKLEIHPMFFLMLYHDPLNDPDTDIMINYKQEAVTSYIDCL